VWKNPEESRSERAFRISGRGTQFTGAQMRTPSENN